MGSLKEGTVALNIDDSVLRDRIRLLLKTRGIKAVDAVEACEETLIHLIVTDRKDVDCEEVHILPVGKEVDEEKLLESIDILGRTPKRCGEVVIGVDPGLTIGVAALCRNSVIDVNVSNDVDQLVDWMRKIIEIVKPPSTRIRIGKGEKWKETLDAVKRSGINETCIQLVDERNTTKTPLPGKWRRYGRDVRAAIKIALKVLQPTA